VRASKEGFLDGAKAVILDRERGYPPATDPCGAFLKFLCDNCKAKYQIADEKVAGKTVRMKCRKCGHQIEVRAAVTETSVSTSLPGASSPGSDAPRPIAKNSLATSLSAAKPRAPMAHQPQNPGGALAGAFQRTVQDAPQTVPFPNQTNNPVELSVTDEWYVAINGVPVGPVRISELRRKAASGAVTEDSLCWQEGLEEWRPVRSIPELAAIVREAAQGNRPSLIAPPPNEGRASSPPRAPQRPVAAAPRPAAPEPGRTSQPSYDAPRAFPSRSNVVPLRVAASSNMEDVAPNTAPLGQHAAALAPSYVPQPAPAFAPQMQPAPAPAPPAPIAIADPFALPPAPLTSSSGTASLLPAAGYAPSMLPPAPKRGVPLWFWPILLFTGVFGAMAAFVVFKQQQQPQPPVVIQMPAAHTPTAPEVKTDIPPPPASGEPAPIASAPTAKVATGGAPKTGGGPVAAAAPPKAGGIDLGGLGPIAGGPNVGAAGAGPGAGGGGLDSSSVERVVASHRSGVKRTCWERGGADQKSSVNVTVSAQVGPAGNVVGTSSSGDDPQVAKCIENQVKGWMFSAPGATTTVNIPFKFVRQ
jgi:predicted Zn finger-like uncharacterized protein